MPEIAANPLRGIFLGFGVHPHLGILHEIPTTGPHCTGLNAQDKPP